MFLFDSLSVKLQYMTIYARREFCTKNWPVTELNALTINHSYGFVVKC